MTQNENSAARRAANTMLRPGDLHAEDPRWIPLIKECRRQMTPTGIGTPPGMEPGGELWMRHYMVAATGYVKWLIHYRIRTGQDSCVLLGYFVTEYLPERQLRPQRCKNVETHGKTVQINQKVKGELARLVRVLIDDEGMPVPVPEQMWAEYGLE